MTIKQISTTYRKITRAFNHFESALLTLKTSPTNGDITLSLAGFTEAATQLASATKTLEKLFISIGWTNLDSTTWITWWKGMTEEKFTLAILKQQEGETDE